MAIANLLALCSALAVLRLLAAAASVELSIVYQPPTTLDEPSTLTATLANAPVNGEYTWRWFYDQSTSPSREDNKVCDTLRPCVEPIIDRFSPGYHVVNLYVYEKKKQELVAQASLNFLMPDSIVGCAISAPQVVRLSDPAYFSVDIPNINVTGNLSVIWTFGDGGQTTTNEAQVQYTYTAPTTYQVSVMVSNVLSTCGPSAATVEVEAPLDSVALEAVNFARSHASVMFVATVNPSGGVGDVSYTWVFGDGSQSNETMPVHSFDTPGRYNVSLAVNNDVSNVTSYRSITIQDTVQGLGIIGGLTGTVGEQLTINATIDSGSHVKYSWSFGDGQYLFDGGSSQSHVYQQTGTYRLNVSAYNAVSNEAVSLLVNIAEPKPDEGPPVVKIAVPIVVTVVSLLLVAAIVLYHRWYFKPRSVETADFNFVSPRRSTNRDTGSVKERLVSYFYRVSQKKKNYATFEDVEL